jgi:hypothetical protein
MKKFIVFSTLSQAKNYIKRNLPTYNHDDGCGCCYSYSYPLIQGKRIVYVNSYSNMGNPTTEVTVIGRYKR